LRDVQSRILVRNVIVNFAGQIMPLLAAVICMPVLASALGIERLGLLNLAWVVLGSFGLLDLGLGRALTQIVATKLAVGRSEALSALLLAGSGLLFGVGFFAAASIWIAAPWLVSHSINVSINLHTEAVTSLQLLAIGLPFMMASTAARGFLEAHQRFGLVNVVRAPLGAVTYLGPVVVLPFSRSLVAAVAVLAIARVVACITYLALCWRLVPAVSARARPTTNDTAALLRTGSWITLANVAGSFVAYADRLVLGAVIPIATLTYYAAPQEVISKLTVVPMTIGAVIFPAFSAASALKSGQVTALFEKMSMYSYIALLPVTFAGAAFAPQWMSLWMGQAFAAHSAGVAQWFCLGVLVNSLAVTPVSFLQAAGRADLTAKLQCYEIPFYVAALWYASTRFGLTGVAVVWVVRILVDALLMYLASWQVLPDGNRLPKRQGRVFGIGLVGFALLWLSPNGLSRLLIFIASATLFLVALPKLLAEEDRTSARLFCRKLWMRISAST
jgi:O-antigen/teichoic acid export membrane protein